MLQAKPQLVPLQVAVAFAGALQGVQEMPQLLMLLFAAQPLPQAWYPAPQVNPQAEPLQVAVAFTGGRHGSQEAPQVATLEFETQAWLQSWKPDAHWHWCVAMSQVPGCGHCPSAAQPDLHCPEPRSQ